MSHKILTICTLFVLGVLFLGCDSGAKKKSDEPVVQELEIDTGEAFNPADSKDDKNKKDK